MDHQMGWQVGGDSGPALVPRKVHESLLLKAVSYTDRDLKMPPQKKLNVEQLADLALAGDRVGLLLLGRLVEVGGGAAVG